MRLNKKERIRKKEIENHFEKILKKAKNYKQVNEFYSGVVNHLIPLITLIEDYNYMGFIFKREDLPLISLIENEHNKKIKIIESLK